MTHQRNFWIPVICGAIILTIGIGARQSFGIFQKPIAADLNVGRELWSFSNALALLLMGVFAPFAGNLADRFGTAPTVGASVTKMLCNGPTLRQNAAGMPGGSTRQYSTRMFGGIDQIDRAAIHRSNPRLVPRAANLYGGSAAIYRQNR